MKTDFGKVLEQTKFLFEWKEKTHDLKVSILRPDFLGLSSPLSLPLLETPLITISVKVGQVWYEHFFDQSEWLIENGQATGLKLLGPNASLLEFKKNLEMGLCV
ncbi:MAG: hypothetical protein NXH75_09755 [Halobacteriovoraceae bacterium]|nr:hypothetical protein [Halobacteriovoraceae bacterium]